MGISLFAQSRVQKTFNKYAETPIASGMRAEAVAQALLNRAGSSVQITSVQGTLTDHFDPKNQIVGLSQQCTAAAPSPPSRLPRTRSGM